MSKVTMDLFEAFETLTARQALPEKGVKPDTVRYLLPLIVRQSGPRHAYALYKALPLPPQANPGDAWLDLWFLRDLLHNADSIRESGWEDEAKALAIELLTANFDVSNLTSGDEARLAQRRRQYIPYPAIMAEALKAGYVSLFEAFRDLAVAQDPQSYAGFIEREKDALLNATLNNEDGSSWTYLMDELERLEPGFKDTVRSSKTIHADLFGLACLFGHTVILNDFLDHGPWVEDADHNFAQKILTKGLKDSALNSDAQTIDLILAFMRSRPRLLRAVLTANEGDVLINAVRSVDVGSEDNFLSMLKIAHEEGLTDQILGNYDSHLFYSLAIITDTAKLEKLLKGIHGIDPRLLDEILTVDNFALFRHATHAGNLDNVKLIESHIREHVPSRHRELFTQNLRSGHMSSPVQYAVKMANASANIDVCHYVLGLAAQHNTRAGEQLLQYLDTNMMIVLSNFESLEPPAPSEKEADAARWRSVTNREAPKHIAHLSPMGFNPALYASVLPFLTYATTRDGSVFPDSHTASLNAYKMACMFKNREEVTRYLEPKLEGYGFFAKQPIHDACLFEIPQEGAWTRHLWRHSLMKHGMKIGRYIKLAPQIEAVMVAESLPFPANPTAMIQIAVRVAYARAAEHPQFAGMCLANGVNEKAFETGLEHIHDGLKETDILPDIMIDGKDVGAPKLYLAKLKPGDLRGFLLGPAMGCCQTLGDAGENVAIHGMTSSYGGFYVIQKKQGPNPDPAADPIIGGSWAWISKEGDLVADSLERRGPVYEDAAIALMDRFAKNVVGFPIPLNDQVQSPAINTVQMGTGGQTPKNLPYPEAAFATPVDHNYRSDSRTCYLLTRRPA